MHRGISGLVVLSLATLGAVVTAPVAGAASRAVSVGNSNFTFSPVTRVVNAGDTVVWTNNDGSTSHTVTSDTDNLLNSPTIGPGAMFSHVFTTPGTYTYHCMFHGSPGAGMHGTIVVRPPVADFNGSGTTDVSVFRPSVGGWYVNGVAQPTFFGLTGDTAVAGDYNGDGTTDFAVFRPSSGQWFVNGGATTSFGLSSDIPVPGDYDGNGTTDLAVFRPSSGQWFVNGGPTTFFGLPGDIPVPGDYDGNGTTDIAVFRPSTGQWFVNGGATTSFGLTGDIPVPGDYGGNSVTDIAVVRPNTGGWFVNGGLTTFFGLSGDVPAPARPGSVSGP